MNKIPLVSVICLSYNHEKYIQQALQSIIAQTYTNFEIIYIDNNSSDQSFEIGNDLLKKSNINFISKKFDSNLGIPKVLNYVINNLIKGDYICLMAMDDWLEKDNITEKINYFKTNPKLGIVYSYGNYYYDDLNKTEQIPITYFKEGMVFDELLKRNFVYAMGTIIKKEVYDKVGLYNEDNSIEDWEFSLRVAQHYPFGLVKTPLFNYRRHSTNYSNGSKTYFLDCFKILAPYKKYHNYKIGYQWINGLYTDFILTNKPTASSFLYLLRHLKYNKVYIKQIIVYFYKLSFTQTK